MPTIPSVNGQRTNDPAVTSLYMKMSQAASTSHEMQGSRTGREPDSGDDCHSKMSLKPDQRDAHKQPDTGQTSLQGRRLKNSSGFVLQNVTPVTDGYVDSPRHQHVMSIGKVRDSPHVSSPEFSATSTEALASGQETSQTVSVQSQNAAQHYSDVNKDANLDDASESFSETKGEDCAGGRAPVLIPVLKTRTGKLKSREGTRERKVSVTDPSETEEEASKSTPQSNNASSCAQATSGEDIQNDPRAKGDQPGDNKAAGSGTPLTKRRISFPADSVLTAVIQDGDTPELLRILSGRHGPGVVQCPGGEGVDVCQANHVGLTALHHAVLANNLDAAKLLLCHGADANAQDVHGFSPLHTAAACGSLPITTLLVLFGADVFSLTHENELPVDVAKDLGIVRVLSSEMTRLVHQELWLSVMLKARAEEAWLLLRKFLACVLLFILHLVSLIRASLVSKSDRRKSD